MEKVLVTGAAGFIGFHLVNRLINQGFAVVGLDNINSYYDVDLKYGRLAASGINKTSIQDITFVESTRWNNYRFIKQDIKETAPLLELFKKEQFDYVVHLAAQAGVRYSLVNPHAYIDSNVYGFLNMLEACRYYPIKHLLYASSSSVYGANRKIPFEETDNVDSPVSLYAATKKSNELFAHTYAHLYNITATGLRFFTVYGPWGRPDMAYFSFTKAILEGKTIKVFNEGKMKRDFTYVDDITGSIVELLPKAPSAGQKAAKDLTIAAPANEIYNIGNNYPVELFHFIATLEKLTGKHAVKELLPMQPGDMPSTFANVDKLQKQIGNVNKTSIEQGLEQFVSWYRSYYKV